MTAIAPHELAGLDFTLAMMADAIAYHEADEDGVRCCTADLPCAARRNVAEIQAAALARTGSASTAPAPQISTNPTPRTAPGGAVRTSRIVADPASEKQISYIWSLEAERDLSALPATARKVLAEIQAGQTVSKTRASSTITALRNARKAPGRISADLASAAQISLLETMAREQGREVRTEGLSRSDASGLISVLLLGRDSRTPAGPATPARTPDLAEGMYRTPDGEVYKIQIAHHGSGRPYAKKLVELDEPRELKNGTRTHEFAHAPGAMAKLTPEMMMTLEEAKAWGSLYGTCCRCGILLTDEKSIAAGLGRVCIKKF